MREFVFRIVWSVLSRSAAIVFVGAILPIPNFGYCQQPHPTVGCEFLNSSAVFVGTVTSRRDEPPINSGDVSPDGWIYTLAVERLFRGPSTETIEVYTENASARFPMEIGKQYLLFAVKFNGRFEITSCGNSALLSEARNSVTALEGLSIPEDAVIEGSVSFSKKDRDTQPKGIVVLIRGEGRTFKVVSDSEGWFRLHVPPGKYSATIQENAGQTFFASNNSVDNPEHFVAIKGHCSGLQFFVE